MAKGKVSEKRGDTASNASKFKQFFTSEATWFIVGLIIFMISVYATISLFSFFFTGAEDQGKVEGLSLFHWGSIADIKNVTGSRGAILSNVLMNEWFGVSTFFLLLFVAFVGLRLMKAKYVNLLRYFILFSILMIWSSLALAFFFGPFLKNTAVYIGGKHGFFLSDLLKDNFGWPGALLIIAIIFIVLMIFLNAHTIPFLRKLFKIKPRIKKPDEEEDVPFPQDSYPEDKGENVIEFNESKKPPKSRSIPDKEFEVITPSGDDLISDSSKPGDETPFIAIQNEDEDADKLLEELGLYDPTLDLSSYKVPPIELLKRYDQVDNQVDMNEQNENKNRIIQTLEHYGIRIKSIKATVGATITLYEIVPEDGIRIAKIKNLEDDIAMSLSALGIRIIAPMPGKGTIGIEVPNKEPQIVSMHSIIASRKFQESNFDLPIALGRTITNEVFMVDLTKLPHLLVAGATGQGKSVGLNAAITSLLYKKHPAELKFVLIDPKMVEFSIYSTIEKHFLAKLPDADKPIITDFTKVIYTLNSLTKEMDDRYELLEKAGSRNVKEYNEKFIKRRLNPLKGHRFMPYIVVIIDEFGDLIMTAGKEIELPIARIAQKARAVGIHMIIATQRPTVNIITGTIKANFPARIAFRVISSTDSKTILDGQGAQQLIGRGDMLFFQGSDMTRVQCAFVDTPEVNNISHFIGSQTSYPTAHMLPEYVGTDGADRPGAVDLSDRDPLFEEAARLIVIHQQGSTSLIQRKFSIGYNRAGRLMDQLEAAEIVGPTQGSKPREVYVQSEVNLEQILNSI